MAYSVGMTAREPIQDALAAVPKQAWRAALDPDGRRRDGARVAELTRWMSPTFTGWPPGIRAPEGRPDRSGRRVAWPRLQHLHPSGVYPSAAGHHESRSAEFRAGCDKP